MNKKKTKLLGNKWFFNWNGYVTFAVSAVALVIIAFVKNGKTPLVSTYNQMLIVSCLVNAIIALGLNFVSGYLGQTSLGHAAFYGLGGYMTAICMKFWNIGFWPSILVGVAVSALVAIPLAAASLRVKGSFLVVITYAFCEIFRYIGINTQKLGGTAGFGGMSAPEIFGIKLSDKKVFATNKGGYILVLFLIVALVAFFANRVEKSRVGYAFSAIREDEIAARAMGINVNYYKTLAMIISAVICSVAGSFQGVFLTAVSPELFSSTKSIQFFTMVVIGGRRSLKGMILGSALITVLPEWLKNLREMLNLGFDPWNILYGLMLIIMMRVRPQGIWGKTEKEAVPVEEEEPKPAAPAAEQ